MLIRPVSLLGALLLNTAISAQSTEKVAPKPASKPKSQAIAPAPDAAELLRLANAAFDHGDWPQAIELFARLLKLDQENPLARKRKVAAEANLEKDRLAAEVIRQKAEATRREEEVQAQTKRVAEARMAQERKKLPLYVETVKGLAQDLDWSGVKDYLEKIKAVEPKHPLLEDMLEVRRREGNEAATRGDYSKTAAVYQWVHALWPEPRWLRTQRFWETMAVAQVAETQRDWSTVLASYEQAKSFAIEPTLVVTKIRQAQAEHGRAEVQQAMTGQQRKALGKAIEQLQSIAPSDPLIAKAQARIQTLHEIGDTWTDSTTGLVFCWVPAGTFQMGSDGGHGNEMPVHPVTLSRGFWMSRTEITQAQWITVMGTKPSTPKQTELPVDSVSWEDCQGFLRKLNERAGSARFRLPTEAEWEYACRAGQEESSADALEALAWFNNTSNGLSQVVGTKPPNAWGLHDLLGNVWEWCQDGYDSYPDAPITDPQGDPSSTQKILRGGSFSDSSFSCRPSMRGLAEPTRRDNDIGFRLVMPAQ